MSLKFKLSRLLLSFIVISQIDCLCPSLRHPLNGQGRGHCSNAKNYDRCQFICNTGYALKGDLKTSPNLFLSIIVRIGRDELTCQANDHWDGPLPTCEMITCQGLREPTDGTMAGACSPGKITRLERVFNINYTCTGYAGRICRFICNYGSVMSGPSSLVCQDDGQWSKSSPTCMRVTRVTCPDLVYRRDGGVFTGRCSPGEPDKTCTLNCATGYKVIGEPAITCGNNGEWSFRAAAPCCEKSYN